MNGSPGNMEVMKEFVEKYGIEFTYKVNVNDEVAYFGKNSANTSNRKHTANGNDVTKGYNKYQEFDKKTGIYKTNIGSNKDKMKGKVKYTKKDIRLIKEAYKIKKGEKHE